MTDVGTRELKARLSEYLDRAARGEIIRVTERGTPKAVLAPLPGRLRLEKDFEEGWIERLMAEPRGPWRRFRATRTVADIVAEDRGE